MRTAQILKLAAHSVIVVGIFFAFKYFHLSSIEFWAVILTSFLLWLILRLLAIVGQLVFEIRNESLRTLSNIERGLHYSNSLVKEIRDMMDSEAIEKKTQ
jgi:hypothetical protein